MISEYGYTCIHWLFSSSNKDLFHDTKLEQGMVSGLHASISLPCFTMILYTTVLIFVIRRTERMEEWKEGKREGGKGEREGGGGEKREGGKKEDLGDTAQFPFSFMK